ncbi:MAG: 2-oxoacid:acceptor oxidoreductase family protein [Dehalococcoidia bacterium]|nr:2-oxoacid:acceptor oxidoreductase family protein [Dehalococcoidia bacterium]
MRKGIILGGTGGQGLILAGVIIAEAATSEGFHVAQSQTYGPEARGGNSACSVVIDDEEIDFPEVEEPDILLVMSKDAAQQEIPKLKKHGVLIVDSTNVKTIPPAAAQIYQVPISAIAKQNMGNEMVANIVALGVLTRLTGILPLEAVENAVLGRVPEKTRGLNRQAFAAGVAAAEEALLPK